MPKNETTKTAWGTIWSIVQKFGTMAISFISSMVLARLLSPNDYGCIGMLMIFVTISQAFVDGGFASALIQKHSPSQTDLSTVFFWNILLSIVLYIALYLGAPFIANFYDIPLLKNVLRVMGLSLIINSFSIVQVAILQIRLEFKQLAIRDIIANLLSVILTIYFAFKGWGVWALVAQILSVGFFKSIILWFSCDWRPSVSFSTTSFRSLLGFGGYMFLTNILNALGNNVQGLLIGRYATPADMGFYSQSKKLSDVASTGFTSVVEQVAFPVMSGYNADNPNESTRFLKRYLCLVAYVVAPLMLFLVLVSKPVITVVYSSKWLPCVPYFNILCIAAIFLSLQAILQSSLAAHGESKGLFIITLIKRTVEISFMLIGLLSYGIYGLLISMIITSIISFFFNSILVHKKIGYRIKCLLSDLAPIALAAIIAFGLALFVSIIWPGSNTLQDVICACLFIGLYYLMSRALKINALDDVKLFVSVIINKK